MASEAVVGDGEMKRPSWKVRLTYNFCWVVAWILCRVWFRFTVVGREKLPKKGPILLVANHGSFLDPIWLGLATRRYIRFFLYTTYYYSRMGWLFRLLDAIPVHEEKQLNALKTGLRDLANGKVVGIFPEGHVSVKGNLQKAKEGTMFMAQRSGASIYPVALRGNVAVLRRGAWFPKPYKVTVVVGDPLVVPREASKKEYPEYAEKLMKRIGELLEGDSAALEIQERSPLHDNQ